RGRGLSGAFAHNLSAEPAIEEAAFVRGRPERGGVGGDEERAAEREQELHGGERTRDDRNGKGHDDADEEKRQRTEQGGAQTDACARGVDRFHPQAEQRESGAGARLTADEPE